MTEKKIEELSKQVQDAQEKLNAKDKELSEIKAKNDLEKEMEAIKKSKSIVLVAAVPFVSIVIFFTVCVWQGFFARFSDLIVLPIIVIFGVVLVSSLALIRTGILSFFNPPKKEDKSEEKLKSVDFWQLDKSHDLWRIMIALLPFIILLAFFLVALAQGYFAVISVALPLIVVLAVAMLVSLLTMMTGILSYFNLTDKREPFGLPIGSVRALIALGLLVIFAVVSIFLYGQVGGSPTLASQVMGNSTLLNQVLGNQTLASQIFGGNQTLTVPPSQDQVNFANQVLTTVSTLLVAVAGFYFGTKAVETAQGVKKKPLIVINPSDSAEAEKGKGLPIMVNTLPKNEAVSWEIDDEALGSLVQEKQGVFKFTPTGLTEKKPATLTFTLAKHPKISEKLKIKLKEPETDKK